MIVREAPAGAGPRGFLGEACELEELAAGLMREVHEVDTGLARLDFALVAGGRALTELAIAGPAAAEAQREGLLSRLARAVVEFLQRVKEWLQRASRHVLEAVMGPRREWLERNKEAILAATTFPKCEVTVGERLASGGGIRSLAASVQKAVSSYVSMATSGSVDSALPREGQAEESASRLEAAYLGEPKSYHGSPSLAGRLVREAEDSFENMGELSRMGREFDALIHDAQQQAGASEAGRASAEMRLRHISAASHLATRMLSAAVSVNSRANSYAMTALVKLRHAAWDPRQSK